MASRLFKRVFGREGKQPEAQNREKPPNETQEEARMIQSGNVSTPTDLSNHQRKELPANEKQVEELSTAYIDTTDHEEQLPLNETQEEARMIQSGNASTPTDLSDDQQEELNKRFWRAAVDGDADLVRKYMVQGAKVDYMDYDFSKDIGWDQAAVHVAARNGHLKIVKILVNEKEARDVYEMTAMHHAAMEGHFDIVEFLIRNGCNLEAVDLALGHSPLIWAAENGHENVIQLLINSGANTEATDKDGQTAVHWASMRGNSATVELLMKNKANIHVVDKEGCSTLMLAAKYGHEETVQLLMNSGVDTEVADLNQRTALHLASYKGQSAVVECLIKNNASVHAVDKYGCLPFHYAKNPQVATLLIDAGSKFDVTNQDGSTVLHTSALYGRSNTFSYFVSKGLNLHAKNNAGNTPLDILRTNVSGNTFMDYYSFREWSSTVNDERNKCVQMLKTVHNIDIPDSDDVANNGSLEGIHQQILNDEDTDSDAYDDKAARVQEAFIRAVKSKGSLTQYILQCLPFGPPRVGKTCLYHRLLDKPVPGNATTKDNPGSGSQSTEALTETKMIQVEIKLDDKCGSAVPIVVDDEGKWSEVPSLNDEIAIYVKSISSANEEATKSGAKKAQSQESKSSPADIHLVHVVSREKPNDSSKGSPNEPQPAKSTPLDEAIIKAITSHVTGKKLDELQVLLDKSITIFYTDTGGQPEFHEVLPALVAGPSIFLLVFGLHQPLDSSYKVLYESSQNNYVLHESSFTVEEVLMQCLSSISSYHLGQLSAFKQQQIEKNDDCRPPPTNVLVIGTHKDLINKKELAEKDQILQNSINAITSTHQEIIERCSRNQLITPVDNYEADDGSVVRKVVERVVKRKERGVSPYKVTLPGSWLCLLLFLRQIKSSTISYSECLKKAIALDIPEEDFESCLHYLHYRTGNIRYYGEIDDLKNIIIIKPKILFAAVTKLIMSTFTLDNVNPTVEQAFKMLGLFKFEDVEDVFDQYKDELEISFVAFTAFLQHLNILVAAHDENYDFFLPSALVHAPKFNAKSYDLLSVVSPLLILFNGGFVPKGVYSGLLAYLCKLGWSIVYEDNTPQLFRNRAVLDCDDIDECTSASSVSCTLSLSPKHIEVSFENCHDQLHIVCPYLQNIITKSMPEVLKKLQYVKKWQFGINCAGPKCGNSQKHFAEVDMNNMKGKCFTTKKKYAISGNDALWFSDFKAQTPSPSVKSQELADEEIDAVQLKRHQINNCIKECENQSANGIIFVVRVYGADGTAKDGKNIEKTFRKLNFAVYVERDPTSVQIAQLIKAASISQLSYRYKYIAFYFAGHGGRDEDGKLFIEGLQMDKSNPVILHIEDHIINPLKQFNRFHRLFFFDCCRTKGSGVPYRDSGKDMRNPVAEQKELIAFAASDGQKSFGDHNKGGIWTYYLCKNLKRKRSLPLAEVLAVTSDDVRKKRVEFQEPMTVCGDQCHEIVLTLSVSSHATPSHKDYSPQHTQKSRESSSSNSSSQESYSSSEEQTEGNVNYSEVFKKHVAKLVDVIDNEKMFSILWSASLISDEMNDYTLTPGIATTLKAKSVMNEIYKSLKNSQNPANIFISFCDIIGSQGNAALGSIQQSMLKSIKKTDRN